MQRRSLITGLISLVAAPAIVRADTLMKLTGERYFFWKISMPLLPDIRAGFETSEAANIAFREVMSPRGLFYEGTWTFFGKNKNVYSDECVSFTKQEYPA